jgi:hypothetical protein
MATLNSYVCSLMLRLVLIRFTCSDVFVMILRYDGETKQDKEDDKGILRIYTKMDKESLTGSDGTAE